MGRVSIEPQRGRFPGVARSTGMDCREISPLRSRRAYAAELEAVAACGGLMKSPQGWKRPFDDPIVLPDGRQLTTLEDAGNHVTELPEAVHELPEWQAAMEALILVATRGGPTMFARIGVMQALNRHVERVFDPSRAKTGIGVGGN